MEYMAAQMDRQIEGAQHAYEAAMQSGQEPAFPTENAAQTGTSTWRYEGMTLRDYFAATALQSGQASNWHDNDYKPKNGLSTIENTARCAYLFADAMLKARATQ